jgi:hypothetical protein
MVCCRYIIVNTLHKGDNKDDDDYDYDDDDDDDDNNNNNNNNNNAVMGAIATRATYTTKTSHPTIHPKSLTPFTESGRQQTF